MKFPGFRSIAVVFGLVLVGVIATVSYAAQSSADKTSMQEVQQEVGDVAEAIRDYSAAQRDEALHKVKAALDKLDGRIDRLQSKIDRQWEQMNQSTRQEAKATLKAVKEKRNEVAEWYGGLKHSSSASWEEVKKGFSKSYKALADAFEKAVREF